MTVPPRVLFATLYDLSTGQITGSLQHTGGASCASSTTGEVDGQFDGATYYISSASGTPTATARPAMGVTADKTSISANGTDATTFSGVPAGATVGVDLAAPVACPVPMQFAASDAGTYALTFSAFPALDQVIAVVAT